MCSWAVLAVSFMGIELDVSMDVNPDPTDESQIHDGTNLHFIRHLSSSFNKRRFELILLLGQHHQAP